MSSADTLNPAQVTQAQPRSSWRISTEMTREQVLATLTERAKRGKLAEFAKGNLGKIPCDFSVDAPAVPFDYRLVATMSDQKAPTTGTLIELRLVRLSKMPILFALILAVTIWPGVWLTDSMLTTYFGWYSSWTQSMPWLTYAWYLPITALPIPWMWKRMCKKSAAESSISGGEMVESITQALNGTAV